MSLLIRKIEEHASSQPDKTVLNTLTTSLSWKQFSDEITSLEHEILPYHTIGMLMENSPAWVIADLAMIKSKKCHIPLPTFFSNDQLKHAINDTRMEIILTDLPERLLCFVDVKRTSQITIDGKQFSLIELNHSKQNSDRGDCNLDGITKITYTSGTTGAPKGVMLKLSNLELVAESLVTAAKADANDRALVLLPLSTLLENIGSIYAPIIVGAQIIVPSPSMIGFSGSSEVDVAKFLKALHESQPTTIIIPPQLLKLIVALASQLQIPDSFKYIAVGGAPVGKQLLRQAKALKLPVFQGYGLSEACSVVAVNTIGENRIGSVGKLLPHQQVRIDSNGEILIKGCTFSGYISVQSSSVENELATGDQGYIEDGFLYITGRIKNRIISSFGRNISPEWIESELLSCGEISQAAVIGNDRPFLTAVLFPNVKIHQDKAYIKLQKCVEKLNSTLPDYGRIKDFVIAEKPFHVSNNQATASGQPNRLIIEKYYEENILNLYEKENKNVF